MDNLIFEKSHTVNSIFTPSDLKTGMFGVTDTDEFFVVVNDIIVYEDGDYDKISDLNENLEFQFGKIKKLFIDCNSFNQAKEGYGVEIYTMPESD